jgi:hypothetical protein
VTPRLRKVALTVHVTTSVGWLGAVACFLVLSILGLARVDPRTAGGAYIAMRDITWWLIVPLCIGTLISGVVQSLGTSWGLFRHYWVFIKLLLTALATVVLLAHTRPIDHVANIAVGSSLSRLELRDLRVQLVGDAAAAIAVLLATTVLSVFKPRGLTRYGLRRAQRTTEMNSCGP